MTDAALVLAVLAVLFAPTVTAVWLVSRRNRRRVLPTLTEADVEVFALELAFVGDYVTETLKREKR